MTDEQKAAYVMSQAAAALIEALGMMAENQKRKSYGASPAYDETAFQTVIANFSLTHNEVVGLFHS